MSEECEINPLDRLLEITHLEDFEDNPTVHLDEWAKLKEEITQALIDSKRWNSLKSKLSPLGDPIVLDQAILKLEQKIDLDKVFKDKLKIWANNDFRKSQLPDWLKQELEL